MLLNQNITFLLYFILIKTHTKCTHVSTTPKVNRKKKETGKTHIIDEKETKFKTNKIKNQ